MPLFATSNVSIHSRTSCYFNSVKPYPKLYFQLFDYNNIIFIENKCLYAIWDLKRERKKKDRPKVGSNRWSIASKRHVTRFTICATGPDVSVDSAVLLLVPPVPWLTDVSSSQRWVIYSQTNGAVSNYTYLFRFVWFVVVFSDLLFCFRICRCVFWLVILFSNLSLCFWLVIMFSELLLCFLNCYFVFYICICVCNLLFCFLNGDLFCTYRPPYITPTNSRDNCLSQNRSYLFQKQVIHLHMHCIRAGVSNSVPGGSQPCRV